MFIVISMDRYQVYFYPRVNYMSSPVRVFEVTWAWFGIMVSLEPFSDFVKRVYNAHRSEKR